MFISRVDRRRRLDGAQQTYEWAVRFAEKVLRAAPIAGTAQNPPHDFLYTEALVEAITSDPGWNGGEYTSNTEARHTSCFQKWQRGDVARHTGGDLDAALGRITAKTFVIPIDEDMFVPMRDCKAEQEHVKGSELRVIEDLLGHLGLFGVAPTYMPQVDQTSVDCSDEGLSVPRYWRARRVTSTDDGTE
jgi:homoserine O-acetyltransferase/O-succinyltransferase